MKKGEELSRQNKRWTQEDLDYLHDAWGRTSIGQIAKHLERTEQAIRLKVFKLGLPKFLDSGEYVTVNQLHIILSGGSGFGASQIKSWIEKRGMPVRNKKVRTGRFKIIYLKDFWNWAEKNKSFLNFAKFEPLSLGVEPDWVSEKRRKDIVESGYRNRLWTSEDDSRLIMLVKQHKYNYAELSAMMNRTAGAISRRCVTLGVNERPLAASPNDGKNKWSEEMCHILADGIRAGDSYTQIGERVGKSEKAVRGKIYNHYLTEDADRVRQMMGDGPWGSGAPEPVIKQAIHLGNTRTETKRQLAKLCGILSAEVNRLSQ